MVSAARKAEQNSATYTVAGDFCRLFEQEMDRLYLLSFLLTADHTKAEQCFVGGLEDSAKGPRVFKEWARSWARRMVVQNAIQMVRPHPAESDAANGGAKRATTASVEISAVLDLPAFERFVFVMSVLERYSDQDCAVLLDSSREDIIAARVRALQLIGSAAEGHRTVANSREPMADDVAALTMKIESLPLLATLP